jgi:hypothetical protein
VARLWREVASHRSRRPVAAARDLYAALLPARERVLGPEHPDTLATRTSLAYWTKRSGG